MTQVCHRAQCTLRIFRLVFFDDSCHQGRRRLRLRADVGEESTPKSTPILSSIETGSGFGGACFTVRASQRSLPGPHPSLPGHPVNATPSFLSSAGHKAPRGSGNGNAVSAWCVHRRGPPPTCRPGNPGSLVRSPGSGPAAEGQSLDVEP